MLFQMMRGGTKKVFKASFFAKVLPHLVPNSACSSSFAC